MSAMTQVTFREVSDSLNFENEAYHGNLWGAGVSFFDVDMDGWDDITMLGTEANGVVVYFNNAGALEPTTFNLGLSGMGDLKRPVWFDYDNDGDNDLLLTFVDTTVQLFEQTGNLQFNNITTAVGLDTITEVFYNVSIGDVDGNDYLDIYACNYTDDSTLTNILYLNDGNVFTDITQTADVGDDYKFTHSAAIVDVNQDELLDIYTINDFADGNTVYINNGDSTFDEYSTSNLNIGMDGMGYDVGDVNRDGEFDVFVSNTSFNKLFLSDSNGSYEEVADSLNIDTSYVSWGCHILDMDLDRDEDIFVISGVFDTIFTPIRNLVFEQNDTGFVERSYMFGSKATESFASAAGDLNNDGLVDLAITNELTDNGQLWQNTFFVAGSWVKLQLAGQGANNAFHSTITSYINGVSQKKIVLPNASYLGQNSQNIILSTGDSNSIDSIKVNWYNSGDTTLYNVQSEQSILLTEGQNAEPLPTIFAPDGIYICPGDTIRLVINGNYPNVSWSTGQQSDTILVSTIGTYSATVTNQFGQSKATHSVQISYAPSPSINFQNQNAKCFGNSNGGILIIPSSGQGPLDYIWENGLTTHYRQHLKAGVYRVTITNEFGCIKVDSTQINQPDKLVSEISSSDAKCAGESSGTASVSAAGGTSPYSYYWSNFSFNSTISSASAGTYSCMVTDILNCVSVASGTIGEPLKLVIDTSSIKSQDSIPTWDASVQVSGGIPPYSIVWLHDTALNTSQVNGLDSGNYSVAVTDSNGCTETVTFSFKYSQSPNDTDTTTGISHGRLFANNWYPNPTNGFIYYNGNTTPKHVKVFAMNGELVSDNRAIKSLNLAGLRSGMYFIETTSVTGTSHQRIIVHR